MLGVCFRLSLTSNYFHMEPNKAAPALPQLSSEKGGESNWEGCEEDNEKGR